MKESQDAKAAQLRPMPARRTSSGLLILPPLMFFGMFVMGADFTAISLAPASALGVPYPWFLNYSHILIPAACTIVWMLLLPKWPIAGSIVAILVCATLLSMIPKWDESYVVPLPVARFLTSDERSELKSKLGFNMFERASTGAGNIIFVAPANEMRARAELRSLGVLRDH
jgi:hypothetical protein